MRIVDAVRCIHTVTFSRRPADVPENFYENLVKIIGLTDASVGYTSSIAHYATSPCMK